MPQNGSGGNVPLGPADQIGTGEHWHRNPCRGDWPCGRDHRLRTERVRRRESSKVNLDGRAAICW